MTEKESKLAAIIFVTVGVVAAAIRFGLFEQVSTPPVVTPVLPSGELHIHIEKEASKSKASQPTAVTELNAAERAMPMGYVPNPSGTKNFLQSLEKPTIRDAGPDLFRAVPGADRKGVFLYRPLQKQYQQKYGKPFVVGKQAIGDCVSWGWMHGIAICCAIQCELGDSSEFDMPATEAIYGGSRVEGRGSAGDGTYPIGGWGDGSYGGAAARWVHRYGVLWRRTYSFADLTTYSGERAKNWGAYGCGGKGDGGKADSAARDFPVGSVALVRSYDEAVAAIRSGYPIPVCSNQGFSSRRDNDGFAQAVGTWAHCMCFIGFRNEPRSGLLCLNSWGSTWISGPKFPDDQPEGSFWVERSVADRMLRGEDSFAISGLRGFPFRDLSNRDWLGFDGANQGSSSEQHLALAP